HPRQPDVPSPGHGRVVGTRVGAPARAATTRPPGRPSLGRPGGPDGLAPGVEPGRFRGRPALSGKYRPANLVCEGRRPARPDGTPGLPGRPGAADRLPAGRHGSWPAGPFLL